MSFHSFVKEKELRVNDRDNSGEGLKDQTYQESSLMSNQHSQLTPSILQVRVKTDYNTQKRKTVRNHFKALFEENNLFEQVVN